MFKSTKVSRYVPAKRSAGTINHVVVVNAAEPLAEIVVGPNAEVAIKSIPLIVAMLICDKPVTVMDTLLDDLAVVGETMLGVPITVMVALAVSLGPGAAAVRFSV